MSYEWDSLTGQLRTHSLAIQISAFVSKLDPDVADGGEERGVEHGTVYPEWLAVAVIQATAGNVPGRNFDSYPRIVGWKKYSFYKFLS